MTNHYFRNLTVSIPFVLATILPFIWLASYFGIELKFGYVALGALGWWIALLLRMPVMLAVKKLPLDRSRNIVTLASGPAEEITRLVILLIIGLSLPNAFSLGLGWAGIEIIYSIIQGIGMGVLQGKTDEKAEEAKAILRSSGMDKSFEPSAPLWGILERVSANALHIAFSLLLVVSPFLVILTAPVHSLANLSITTLVKKSSLMVAELVLFVLSVAIFAIAVALTV